MESTEIRLDAAVPTSRMAHAARTIAGATSRRIAAVAPRTMISLLACVQWLLAAVTGIAVGHQGAIAVVVLQLVFLLPAALAMVYAVASRMGGRTFAAWATSLWIVLPYAGIGYATPSLRHQYVHAFLPRMLGLADDPRYAAMVAFLAATFFALRALESATGADVAIAVAASGIGAALVPREALIALAPVACLIAGGGRRRAVAAAAGVAIVLAGVGAAVAGDVLSSPFAQVGLREPADALASLRENFWSGRVLEWLAIAGVAGAVRGRRQVGVAVGVALAAAFASLHPGLHAVETNLSLLRALLPVWPALTLAVASIPLLWPRR